MLPLVCFFAMAGSLLFSLGALVIALREPGLRWKPLWALLSLVGVGGVVVVLPRPDELHWFFGVAMPTASFATSDQGWYPHTLSLLFPVGAAIVFLRVAGHRRARAHAEGTGTS